MVDDSKDVVVPSRVADLIEDGRITYRELLPGERVRVALDLRRNSDLFSRSSALLRRTRLTLAFSVGLLLLAEGTILIGLQPAVAVVLTGLSALSLAWIALLLVGYLRRWHAAMIGAQARQERPRPEPCWGEAELG